MGKGIRRVGEMEKYISRHGNWDNESGSIRWGLDTSSCHVVILY